MILSNDHQLFYCRKVCCFKPIKVNSAGKICTFKRHGIMVSRLDGIDELCHLLTEDIIDRQPNVGCDRDIVPQLC